MRVIICKGLPASGKSTWAKEFVKENKSAVRINKDDLREMLHNSIWNGPNEKAVLAARDNLIKLYMERKVETIIIDDTNFAPKHEECIKTLVEIQNTYLGNVKNWYDVETKFFDTPLEECLKRDAKREKSVGKGVILKMWNQYLKPKPVEIDSKLPYCIVCDLDGTLANLNGRNPYDASTCENDLVVKPVQDIIHRFTDQCSENDTICFVSGREDKYKEQTNNWLSRVALMNKNEYTLLMRKTGDNRDDTIVKKEIYENYIKDKYNVTFVIDDRPKVIRMWRELGLFVFDVGMGYEF